MAAAAPPGTERVPGFPGKVGQAHRAPILHTPPPSSPLPLLTSPAPAAPPGRGYWENGGRAGDRGGVTPVTREAVSGQPPGPQDHAPQAVPPTAAGLEPAAPRALLASARGRVARSPVETEEKARAPPAPGRRSGKREVAGGQGSACSTFSRFRGLPDGQGAAWECDDAGGHKAPGSRPTWRPSRRTPTVAPLHSEVHTSAFQLLVAKRRGNRDRRVHRARDQA